MNIVYIIIFLLLWTLKFSYQNNRFLNNNNKDCFSKISNCVQCSSNFSICFKCKNNFNLSSDLSKCQPDKTQTTLKIILTIAIPILVLIFAIIIGLLIKIKLNKRLKPLNKAIKQSTLMKISVDSNTEHQSTCIKYTNISTKSKFNPNINSKPCQLKIAQQLPATQSNANLITSNSNNNNSFKKLNTKEQPYKNKKTNVFLGNIIKVNPLKKSHSIDKYFLQNKSKFEPSDDLQCSKCSSRNIYYTLTCGCHLCWKHFKEITGISKRTYICEKHNIKEFTQANSYRKYLPNLSINRQIKQKEIK